MSQLASSLNGLMIDLMFRFPPHREVTELRFNVNNSDPSMIDVFEIPPREIITVRNQQIVNLPDPVYLLTLTTSEANLILSVLQRGSLDRIADVTRYGGSSLSPLASFVLQQVRSRLAPWIDSEEALTLRYWLQRRFVSHGVELPFTIEAVDNFTYLITVIYEGQADSVVVEWSKPLLEFLTGNDETESTTMFERWLLRQLARGSVQGIANIFRRAFEAPVMKYGLSMPNVSVSSSTSIQFSKDSISLNVPPNPNKVNQLLDIVYVSTMLGRTGDQYQALVKSRTNTVGDFPYSRLVPLIAG